MSRVIGIEGNHWLWLQVFDEVDIGGFGRALLRQSLHCDVVLTALHCTSVAFMGALLISKTVLIDTPSMSKGIVVVGATQELLIRKKDGPSRKFMGTESES